MTPTLALQSLPLRRRKRFTNLTIYPVSFEHLGVTITYNVHDGPEIQERITNWSRALGDNNNRRREIENGGWIIESSATIVCVKA